MKTKLLLILIIVGIVSGIILVERVMVSKPEPSEQSQITVPTEEIPDNRFKDVQISYYGEGNRFKLESAFNEIIQQTDVNVQFQGLEAAVKEDGEIVQRFSTLHGWMTTDQGTVKLAGPVSINRPDFQLNMDRMDIDLNQGRFNALGSVVFTADALQIQADEMASDFDLKQIHFKGRPKLTIKKGG